MKKIFKALPFVGVLAMLLGSVFAAKELHSKKGDRFHVNTGPDKNGEIHTVRKFESISSVVVIDMDKHSKKRKIPDDEWIYDAATTKLTFKNPLPYKNPVVHVEGKIVRPEKFYLHDFSETSDSLLVLLDGREALENYEYTFSPETRTLTFRNDIHPENDGIFFIMYQTQDGQTHSFGNWSKKDGDRLSELSWKWLSKQQNIPPMVMKDRSGVSNKKLSKEAGFSIQLPKGDSTFIIEKMKSGERAVSVMRWFDKTGLVVECKSRPFLSGDETQVAEEMQIVQIGGESFTKQKIKGSQTDASGNKKEVYLIVYEWKLQGTFYQMNVEESKSGVADAAMKEFL